MFAGAVLALIVAASPAAALSPEQDQMLSHFLASCDPKTGVIPDLPRVIPHSTSGGTVIIGPSIITVPTAETLTSAYPPLARGAHVSSRVMVHCKVGVDGQGHDCTATEDVPGYGFGDAALKVVSTMLILPQINNCKAVDLGTMFIPVRFPAY